jgi:sigma-E factor negative regulatory protein RseA
MMATGGDCLITRTVMEIQMDTQKKIREHISALSDGELSASDLELAFAALRAADGELAWSSYHRIGDVLRAQATPDLSDSFSARLAARLAAEPAYARRAPAAPVQAEPAAPSAKKVAITTS